MTFECIDEKNIDKIFKKIESTPPIIREFHTLIYSLPSGMVERLAINLLNEDDRQKFINNAIDKSKGDEIKRHEIYRDVLHFIIIKQFQSATRAARNSSKKDKIKETHLTYFYNLFKILALEQVVIVDYNSTYYVDFNNVNDRFVLVIHVSFNRE